MSFLEKLFGKKQDEGANPEKVVEALEAARVIVKAYGDFMQTAGYPAPGCVADASKLPYDKELIKAALKLCVRVTENEDYRSALRVAYVGLADFQPGVGEKNLGVTVSDVPDISDREHVTEEELRRVLELTTQWARQLEEAKPFLLLAEMEKESLRREAEDL